MKPVSNFQGIEANVTYKAPGCLDLPVIKTEGLIISAWELSDEELEDLKENRIIYLGIVGEQQPPVMVTPDLGYILTATMER